MRRLLSRLGRGKPQDNVWACLWKDLRVMQEKAFTHLEKEYLLSELCRALLSAGAINLAKVRTGLHRQTERAFMIWYNMVRCAVGSIMAETFLILFTYILIYTFIYTFYFFIMHNGDIYFLLFFNAWAPAAGAAWALIIRQIADKCIINSLVYSSFQNRKPSCVPIHGKWN